MDRKILFNEVILPKLVEWMNNEIRFYLFANIGRINFSYSDKFLSKENAAECSYERRTIIFNIEWLEERANNNEYYLIEYLLMHEVRHFYQRRVVESFERNEPVRIYEDINTVKQWQSNFKAYVQNKGGQGLSEKEYFCQSIEVDADAFAVYLMLHLHPSIDPRALWISPYSINLVKAKWPFFKTFMAVADQNKRYL